MHSVHMAVRAVAVYLFINITPKYTHNENKLKIIILIDENDSLAAIYFKTCGRGGPGSIKIRMQVSSEYCYIKFSIN